VTPGVDRTPVLEVGGTHVSAAWIEPGTWTVRDAVRCELDGRWPADRLLAQFCSAAQRLSAPPGGRWGVAMPGPFDYRSGIGRFTGVGKFEALNGVDVRAALEAGITGTPASISFINDASAFLVGEWLAGAARGTTRCAALTLGTGIGSAFLADGIVVDSGPWVPPDGEAHLLSYRGMPLEHWVSRRALRTRFAAAHAADAEHDRAAQADVREIADLAQHGDPVAATVFTDAFTVLGEVLGPWLHRFGAEVVVLGGSISAAWDLIAGPLHEGLAATGDLPVVVTADGERAALIGSAYPALG
jgi:glucokinase